MGSVDFSQNSVIQPGFLIRPSASSPVILRKDIKKKQRDPRWKENETFSFSAAHWGILQVCIVSSKTGSRKWGEEVQTGWWQCRHIRLACGTQHQWLVEVHPFTVCPVQQMNPITQTPQVLGKFQYETYFHPLIRSQWVFFCAFLKSLYTQRSKIIEPVLQRT